MSTGKLIYIFNILIFFIAQVSLKGNILTIRDRIIKKSTTIKVSKTGELVSIY